MQALTLVKDGIILVKSVNVAYLQCPNLPKSINTSTGKQSSTAVSFNNDRLGDVSQGFTKVAPRIAKLIHQFKRIESTVKGYLKCTTHNMDSLTTGDPQDFMNNENELALLTDNYNSDDNTSMSVMTCLIIWGSYSIIVLLDIFIFILPNHSLYHSCFENITVVCGIILLRNPPCM